MRGEFFSGGGMGDLANTIDGACPNMNYKMRGKFFSPVEGKGGFLGRGRKWGITMFTC